MEMLIKVLLIISTLILIAFIRHYQLRKAHPPGPLGCPYFGFLPSFVLRVLFPKIFSSNQDNIYYKQMKERYGEMWSKIVASKKIVCLASFELINESFMGNGTLFSGRPTHGAYEISSEGCGILFTEGKLWQENRQLAIKALRDLGMGKKQLETEIMNEVDVLIEYLEKNLIRPIQNPNTFVKAVSNVISRLAFNERNKYDDLEFQHYIKCLNHISHSSEVQKIIGLFPRFFQTKIARRIFKSVDFYLTCNSNIIGFIADKCRSRIKVESEYSKPNCVFDYFWRYRYQDDPNIKYDDKFLNITHSLFDLYNAGVDTTTNTIGFSFLILGQNQEIQKELRKEIQSLVDDYKLINMDMRKDCPKLLSFIDEVQRFCFLVPKVYRRVMETCMFRGYKLVPSDLILGDLSTLSRDPNHFDNPDTFDPYRFMDKSRTKYISNKYLIPFGLGKRVCLGESIAVMELFLFISKIIHRFDISLTKDTLANFNDILVGGYGLIHAPLNHNIILKLNNNN